MRTRSILLAAGLLLSCTRRSEPGDDDDDDDDVSAEVDAGSGDLDAGADAAPASPCEETIATVLSIDPDEEQLVGAVAGPEDLAVVRLVDTGERSTVPETSTVAEVLFERFDAAGASLEGPWAIGTSFHAGALYEIQGAVAALDDGTYAIAWETFETLFVSETSSTCSIAVARVDDQGRLVDTGGDNPTVASDIEFDEDPVWATDPELAPAGDDGVVATWSDTRTEDPPPEFGQIFWTSGLYLQELRSADDWIGGGWSPRNRRVVQEVTLGRAVAVRGSDLSVLWSTLDPNAIRVATAPLGGGRFDDEGQVLQRPTDPSSDVELVALDDGLLAAWIAGSTPWVARIDDRGQPIGDPWFVEPAVGWGAWEALRLVRAGDGALLVWAIESPSSFEPDPIRVLSLRIDPDGTRSGEVVDREAPVAGRFRFFGPGRHDAGAVTIVGATRDEDTGWSDVVRVQLCVDPG